MANVNYRKKIVALMRATVADEATAHTWRYEAVRPMPVPPTWKAGQDVYGDCSKGAQFLCKWVGAVDPMGEDYGPFGNSQTLWSRLQHLDSQEELLAGDFVTFGRDGEEHATVVCEPGPDPLLWSFGHQGTPEFYRLSADRRPAQYLRNPLPKYVPTPEERCRARTGWFAWMSWTLSEGDWKGYKLRDPAVRPNVPKRIPVSWWIRRMRFLRNRKRGNPPSRPLAT